MKGHNVLRERGDRLNNGARPHWKDGVFYGVLTSSWSQPIVYRCADGETFEFLGVIPAICEYECQLAEADGRFYAVFRGAKGDNFWVSDDGCATFRPCGRLPDGRQRPQLFAYGSGILIAYSAPDEKPNGVRNGRNNLHILLGKGDDLSAYREVMHAIDPLGIVYYDFVDVGGELYVLWSNAERFPTYVKWGAVQGKDQVLFSKIGQLR